MSLPNVSLPRRSSAQQPALTRLHTLRVQGWHMPLLLLLTLLLTLLVFQQIRAAELVIGPADRRMVQQAHEPEPAPDGSGFIRWTTDATRLDLPRVAAGTPLLLDVTLINSYPAGVPDPTVRFAIGDETLARASVPREAGQPRTYRMLVPTDPLTGWALPVTLLSSTYQPGGEDTRALGVMLAGARLATPDAALLLPPLWQLTAMLLIATASYLALRGVGSGRGLAWAGGMLVVLLIAGGLRWNFMEIAPYTMRVAGMLGLIALYGLGVHLLSVVALPTSNRPTADSAGGWWRVPVALPAVVLLMGLAHWLMPVYQMLQTLDGARNVSPYPPTALLLLGVLLVGGIGLAVLWDAERGQSWSAWLLGVLGVAAVLHLAIMLHFAFGRSGPDFWILFKGAREWTRGGSMYDLEAVLTNHFGHVFKVPPFYGMLFTPFATQDGLRILFYHRLLNVLLLAITALLLFRGFGVRLLSALGAGTLLLFNMRPIADTIAYGQIDIMLLLLLVITLLALRRGWGIVAGVAVALATLFKLYPAVLLALFVVRRQWRAVAGFVLGMLLCNGLALAIIGWGEHRTYLFEVVPRIGGGTAWVENQTLNGFVGRLLSDGIRAEKLDHPLLSLVTYGGFALALAGTLWLALQPTRRDSPRFALQVGLFAILMVLFVPAAWMHYQTITLLPMFAVLLFAATEGLHRWQAALFGGAYALIAFGNQWSFYDSAMLDVLTVLGTSYKFYGVVLLTVVIVSCLLRPQPAAMPMPAAPLAVLRQWWRGSQTTARTL